MCIKVTYNTHLSKIGNCIKVVGYQHSRVHFGIMVAQKVGLVPTPYLAGQFNVVIKFTEYQVTVYVHTSFIIYLPVVPESLRSALHR